MVGGDEVHVMDYRSDLEVGEVGMFGSSLLLMLSYYYFLLVVD